MSGQYFYEPYQLKSGKWRIRKVESQSLMSWRGDNDKVTVVRDFENCPFNFDTEDQAKAKVKELYDEEHAIIARVARRR